MTDPRFARLQEIYAAAVALPAAERAAFVRAACGNDLTMLAEVEAMFAAGSWSSGDLLGPMLASDPSDAPTEFVPRPPAQSDRYVVERQLGRGGMGNVFLVRDRELPRHLALKVPIAPGLDGTQTLARFLNEARITASLSHPGVVPVHRFGHDESGRPFFTMRNIDGDTARQVFAKARAGADGWTRPRALDVLQKVCDTMAYAHQQGVVHRDLKPDNVMVGAFGEVYVLDWGVAKMRGQTDELPPADLDAVAVSGADRTAPGVVLGTPHFMSPEQAAGQLEALDARSDVYAVGAMLYELLAGRAPYASTPRDAVIAAVQAGPPPAVETLDPGAPPELVSISSKAMARQPADRYQTMAALAADLRAFVERRVVEAYEQGAFAMLRKWIVRNKGLAASLAALVVLAIGVPAFVMLQSERAAQRELMLAQVEKAHLAMRSGAWRDALAALDAAHQAGDVDEVDVGLDAAEAHLGLLDLTAARQVLGKLETRADLGAQRGRLLLLRAHATPERVGEPDRARDLFERALELELDPADAEFARGVLAADSAEALQRFEAALQARPFHVGAFQRRLSLLLSLGRLTEIEEQIRLARLSSPRDPAASAAIVLAHAASGRFADARAAMHEATELLGDAVRQPLAELIDAAEHLGSIAAERASDAFEDWAPGIIAMWTADGDALSILSPPNYATKEAYEAALAAIQPSGILQISKIVSPDSAERLQAAADQHAEASLHLLIGQALVIQPLPAGETQSDKWRRCLPFFEQGMASSTLLYGVRRLSRHLFLRCAHNLALHAQDKAARAKLLQCMADLEVDDRLQWGELLLFVNALCDLGDQALPLELMTRWLRVHPDDDEARSCLSRCWTLAGAPERGRETAREILARNPEHASAKSSHEFALAHWKQLAERATAAMPAGK